MSLTINNNSLAQQQQAIQAQTAQTQSAAAAAQAAATTTAPAATTTTATANPSAALISGNAGLTSDLLSVLLQQQSTDTGSSDSVSTLAGLLDQQAGVATDSTSTTASSSGEPTLAGMLDQEDAAQGNQDDIDSLDPSLAAQSATSTGSVMDGLQDLLDQLAV